MALQPMGLLYTIQDFSGCPLCHIQTAFANPTFPQSCARNSSCPIEKRGEIKNPAGKMDLITTTSV